MPIDSISISLVEYLILTFVNHFAHNLINIIKFVNEYFLIALIYILGYAF